MAQSDARFGYQAKLSREDHDLSRPFGFTTPPGYLNPIFADFATPGDSYYIKHDLTYLRTIPLLAPAMVDVLVHYETFFVPLQMIYQPGENTLFSLSNLQSSNFNPNTLLNEKFPLFDYADYTTMMIGAAPTDDKRAMGFRLADLLDLNPDAFRSSDVSHGLVPYAYRPSFFPWQILVYNTIFNYYYRLDDKTTFSAADSNWDRYYSTSTPVKDPTLSFMKIHRRPWHFDYFTSSYRSPIVSSQNMQNILKIDQFQPLVDRKTVPIDSVGTTVSSNNNTVRAFGSDAPSSYTYYNLQSSLSTAMIRQMFANEKLAMITGRTRKNYDSQVLAHYGVDVPHDVKHDLTLIGRDTYKLNIGEVTSLAATSRGSLGEIAGKGWASSPDDVRQHKFTAPCHGFVMTIFSIEPRKRYKTFFGRQNAIVDAFDFPVPEYDRLGNVPMFNYEIGVGDTDPSESTGKLPTDITLWKERYYWNKRSVDKVSYAFYKAGSAAANLYSSYFIQSRPFGVGPDAENVIDPMISSSPFYISPYCMDSLFGVSFSTGWYEGNEDWSWTPHLVYARDPFIVDSYEKVTKVSWMSKDGEPIYPY